MVERGRNREKERWGREEKAMALAVKEWREAEESMGRKGKRKTFLVLLGWEKESSLPAVFSYAFPQNSVLLCHVSLVVEMEDKEQQQGAEACVQCREGGNRSQCCDVLLVNEALQTRVSQNLEALECRCHGITLKSTVVTMNC